VVYPALYHECSKASYLDCGVGYAQEDSSEPRSISQPGDFGCSIRVEVCKLDGLTLHIMSYLLRSQSALEITHDNASKVRYQKYAICRAIVVICSRAGAGASAARKAAWRCSKGFPSRKTVHQLSSSGVSRDTETPYAFWLFRDEI
jgi:hypothetical protein